MLPQIKLAGIRPTMAHSESQAFKQGQTTVTQAKKKRAGNKGRARDWAELLIKVRGI